ncbi:MAG: 30S ribosomal protein S17 [Patescibacteria group bacterium]
MNKKKLTGIVVSDKMQKTVVVEVERVKEHPKYKRRFKVHKKYKAHDEKQEFHEGDKVVIEEVSPISKEKRWKVINKIQNSNLKSQNES